MLRLHKYKDFLMHTHSSGFQNVPLSGEDAFHHERAGTIGAYLPMSGQHQLSFKLAPVAGQTQQSVEITVLYRSVSTLTLDKGNVRVQHS